jgi:phosphomannomutase
VFIAILGVCFLLFRHDPLVVTVGAHIANQGDVERDAGATHHSVPVQGGINFVVSGAKIVVQRIIDYYSEHDPVLDYTDGASAEFSSWHFNLRSSNTEPLLRLNIDSERVLVEHKLVETRELIE